MKPEGFKDARLRKPLIRPMKGLEIDYTLHGLFIFIWELIIMHMADALISPAVGGTMWAAAAGAAAYSMKKIRDDMDEKRIPLMGVMGAFVFAAQMINFSIPGTGSSGHIGGGILLSVLLGPYAAMLTMASVLLIQALFFADGGLLAYGCNVFNLGVLTCFIAYPLVYRIFIRKGYSVKRIFTASIFSAVAGLQLGAFSVVLETLFSGKTELPFGTFVMLMQPIHLAVGIVEGLVTAAVVSFLWKARPEIIAMGDSGQVPGSMPMKRILIGFAAAAVITGGILSWFASSDPDGLEWSVAKLSGRDTLAVSYGIHRVFSEFQSRIAIMPDYSFRDSERMKKQNTDPGKEQWPAANGAASAAGLIGGFATIALAVLLGLLFSILKRIKKRTSS